MKQENENYESLSATMAVKTKDESLSATVALKLGDQREHYRDNRPHRIEGQGENVMFGSSSGRSMKDAGLLTNHSEENVLAMPPKCLTVKGTRKFQELLTLDLISTHSFNFQKGSFLRQLSNIRT
jgi:hypothetical protein